MRITTLGRILFLMALLAAATIPAEAQFGALRRAAAGAAARAAGNGAAGAAAPAAARTSAAPPAFDHETLEITGPVAQRFTAAMAAERHERARLAAERATLGEAQAAIERFERCQRREEERREAADQSVDQVQQAQLAARMTQAMMRGDTGTYRRMMDSLTNAQVQRAAQASAACGARPSEAYATQARLQNAEQRIVDAAAEAGGFTVRQLGILRERIAPYVLAGGQLAGGEQAYTVAEREVLRAALPGLTGYATELRT